MSFADPIVVTYNAVATNLARIFQSVPGGPSLYSSTDGTLKAEISHTVTKGRRERHLWKLSRKTFSPNPFLPAENIENVVSCHVVIDNPNNGMTDADIKLLASAALTYVNVSGTLDKLIAGEG